jgi:hypothetical protein
MYYVTRDVSIIQMGEPLSMKFLLRNGTVFQEWLCIKVLYYITN